MTWTHTQQLRTIALSILVLALTVGAWTGLDSYRSTRIAYCRYSCATFPEWIKHDPYCIFDPGCMSPFFSGSGAETDSAPHWSGYEWLGESAGDGFGWSLLAIPNYIGFLLLFSGLAAIVAWQVHRRLLKRLLLTVITVWVLLNLWMLYQGIMWYGSSYSAPSSTGPTLVFVLMLTLTLSIVWGAAIGTARLCSRHCEANDPG
jgi:hypothetical protein